MRTVRTGVIKSLSALKDSWYLPLYQAQTSSSHFSHLFLPTKAIYEVIERVCRQGKCLSLYSESESESMYGKCVFA